MNRHIDPAASAYLALQLSTGQLGSEQLGIAAGRAPLTRLIRFLAPCLTIRASEDLATIVAPDSAVKLIYCKEARYRCAMCHSRDTQVTIAE